MACEVAALNISEIAVLDALEDLRLRAQDRVLRFRNVTVNHGGEGGVLLLLEAARPLKLGLAFPPHLHFGQRSGCSLCSARLFALAIFHTPLVLDLAGFLPNVKGMCP